MSIIFRLLPALAGLASASIALAGSMDGTMPLLLARDAAARHCEPVKNFFDRPGITLPSFVFDEQPENREYRAAYICERDERYLIVFLDGKINSTCKREIALQDSMPGGLAVFHRRVPLSVFRQIDSSVPGLTESDMKGETRFRPVVIDYDGVQRLLYCHKGKWLQAQFH